MYTRIIRNFLRKKQYFPDILNDLFSEFQFCFLESTATYLKIICIFYDSITSIFPVFIDMSKYTIKSAKKFTSGVLQHWANTKWQMYTVFCNFMLFHNFSNQTFSSMNNKISAFLSRILCTDRAFTPILNLVNKEVFICIIINQKFQQFVA